LYDQESNRPVEEDEMDIKEIVKSQYHASLDMLEQTIVKCPETIWNHPDHKGKFWHIAYHVIFYTHLYLNPTEEDFRPWEHHREEYQFLGPVPYPPHHKPDVNRIYTKEEVLAYLNFCREQVDPLVDSSDMEAESGFYWLSFGKLEHQFYNIRHVQHHTSELAERLGTMGNIEIDWVGKRKKQ
jgi:hypothetical protein